MSHYANECRNEKSSSWDDKRDTFSMMCYENSEEEKYENWGRRKQARIKDS